MPRVLLIAYYFPPQPEAGAVRPSLLRRYLPGFGWEVDVATLRFPGLASEPGIIAIPNRLVITRAPARASAPGTDPARPPRGVLGAVRAAVGRVYWGTLARMVPDPALLWALETVVRLAGRTGVYDAVISSAHPPSAHLAGALLARIFGVPWVADYRDLWTGYPYGNKSLLRRAAERALEVLVVRRAAALSTVSADLGAALERLHRRSDVAVIPNGADAQAWERVPDEAPQGFRVTYAGMLYGGQRTPELLFAAIASLRAAGDPLAAEIVCDFYGGDADLVTALAARYNIADRVRARGVLERAAVLLEQRRSAVLLVLLNMDPATAAEFGSKIFEYAGARRPVLAIGPPASVVRGLLASSGLGTFVSSAGECATALRALYARFRAGEIAPRLQAGWRPPSGADLAARFAQRLDDLSGRSR